MSALDSIWALGQHLPTAITRRLPRQRSVVFAELAKGGVGVEVGVWKGDFSASLLSRAEPRKLHLVDPWKFFDTGDYVQSLYGGADARSQADMDQICADVEARFAGQIASKQVEVHRMPSVEFAAEVDDESIDWVYIDGDHTHDAVLADLEAFYPKIKTGGIIAGDDYNTPGWWHDGVTTAVNEFVRTRTVTVLAVHNEQFVLRKD